MRARAGWAASLLVLIASQALAQVGGPSGGPSGGMGRGGHGGGRGGGGRGEQTSSRRSDPGSGPARKATDAIEISGVITEIDRAHDRVTIAYEARDDLNLPRGTMPFPVTKSELLNGRSVGEKVRFKLESHQIYALSPASSPTSAPPGG